MPFKYSCFISYSGDGWLVKKFVTELKEAIDDRVDLYSNFKAYLDDDRLNGGQIFNEALAGAICRSFCMVVVYTPKYEDRTYCRHEYATMEDLETERRPQIARYVKDYGLIIPVILKEGIGGVPDKIIATRKAHFFKDYGPFGPRIRLNKKYEDRIVKIADTIELYFRAFQQIANDPCRNCDQLRIRPDLEIMPWRTRLIQAFPNRETA